MKHMLSDSLKETPSFCHVREALKVVLACLMLCSFDTSAYSTDRGLIRTWNNDGFAAYESGRNATASRLFQKAAAAGDISAKYNLAVMKIRSETRSITRSQALLWLRHSADAGFAPAQFMLAELMESGEFTALIKRPRQSAHRYYELAAAQGHPDAAHALALKYLLGRGIAPSDEQAAHWYSQAAKAGDVAAQYTLGSFYERGAGVERDLQIALQWYNAAARQGDLAAREKAKSLIEQIARERNS